MHEVTYGHNGEITEISPEPTVPTADSGQHLSNLMVIMMGAFREPVIDSAELHQHKHQQYQKTLTGFWDKVKNNARLDR